MMHDVIVIGGGLAGAATAYYLAADGVEVLLLERSDLNTQASGSNAGSLHAQIPFEPFAEQGEAWAQGFAPVVRLLARSIEMWRVLPTTLGAELEVDLKGGLIAARNDAELRLLEGKVALEKRMGLDVELISRGALNERAPYLSDRLIGGAFCPCEGKANPMLATPAFAAAAQRCGAVIRRHCEVLGLARVGDSFDVATRQGAYRARRVVNAAGAEAGRIAALLGLQLNVQGYPIQVSVTEPTEPLVPHLVYYTGEKLSLKQTTLGAFLIGGGWPARVDAMGRPVVDPDSLARNLRVALEVVPALASVNLLRTWAAVVNGTDDWKPLLGEVPGMPGFFLNFFPWLGFTAGPVAARIVASLVQGQRPLLDVDVSAFALR